MEKGKYIKLNIPPLRNMNCAGLRMIAYGYGHEHTAVGENQIWVNITCPTTSPTAKMILRLKKGGVGYTGRDVEIDVGKNWNHLEIPDKTEIFDEPKDDAEIIGEINKNDLLKLRTRWNS